MTQDDIIRMAWEAGIEVHERKHEARIGLDVLVGADSTGRLNAFADLVAAAEREACAQVCENERSQWDPSRDGWQSAHDCAAAIRARGEKGRA